LCLRRKFYLLLAVGWNDLYFSAKTSCPVVVLKLLFAYWFFFLDDQFIDEISI
jgi:hypothetical protein